MLVLTNFLFSSSSAVQCSDEPVPQCGGAGVLHQGGEHFQGEASNTEDILMNFNIGGGEKYSGI